MGDCATTTASGDGLSHTWGVFEIQINMKLLLLLLPLATAVPIKIISYSATEEKHNHEMEGVPGEAVMGEFSFKAPDTGDAVYKLTYTADMDGFQAMGDHLPVPVIMDPVPEPELPAMVDYTPEVAAARAEFLRAQEEIMARHAAEDAENMVDDEVEEEEGGRARRHPHPRQRAPHHLPPSRRRLPDLPELPSSSGESSHHQPSGLHSSWRQLSHLQDHPQVATDVSATIEEGDDEPAALAL